MTHHNTRLVLILLPIIVGTAFLTLLPLLQVNKITIEGPQVQPSRAGLPYGSIQLSDDRVYRGAALSYNVSAMAEGYTMQTLNWSFDIQNLTKDGHPDHLEDWINLSTSILADTARSSPVRSNTWIVDPVKVSAGCYRVILWIKNETGGVYNETWVFKEFEVLNNLPVINSIYANKYSVNRGESFNVSVGVTDVEIADLAPSGGTEDIFVRIYYRDTRGATDFVKAHGMGSNNYSALIDTLGITSPTGVYTFWAVVQDFRPGMESKENVTSNVILVTIRNNNPSIDVATGLIINDQLPVDVSISVRMGNTINMTIIASDPENSIRFILINLLHESGTWKNYTLSYMFNPHTLIIDTADLSEGEWFIYLSIIDADGGIYEPEKHPSIMILADTWTIAAPIVFFIIGTVVGIAIGFAFFSWRGRRQAARQIGEAPVAEEEPKSSPEKARKITPRLEQNESKEEESGVEEESEGEDKTAMKRKIRRRIN